MVVNNFSEVVARLLAARPGRVFVFSGPSGAGKSTVCRALLESVAGLVFSVSHTTRPPRAGEEEGLHYHFVSDEEFDRIKREGGFIEFALVHGHWYGTSRAQLEAGLANGDVVLDVDVQGARGIKAAFPAAVGVFVLPPSAEALRSRLVDRGQNDPDDIERRLAEAEIEMGAAGEFDYYIINDRLEEAVAAAACIVGAERHRIPPEEGER
ncbi:MAG: guanylate kinase [Candidatus Coatesbacteria bacterium]|nr:MAG: guanylate kinase [Candidatus Coatesbacteria bacterium]